MIAPPCAYTTTTASPCTGCSMVIHNPLLVQPPWNGADNLWHWVDVPHSGCSGDGTWKRLERMQVIVLAAKCPERKRWWQR